MGAPRNGFGVCVRVGMLALLVGCGGPEAPPADGNPDTPSSDPSSEVIPAVGAGVGGFGFGQVVSAEEIAIWDIDIRPDGSGLPPGRGTVAQGADVYQANCLACHGGEGQGGPNDVLVGLEPRGAFPFGSTVGLTSTIGNYWPYATTVFDYVRRAMPFDRPGSLSDDEVYAVTAWLLWRNEIIPEDATMDALSLPQVVMPAKRFFVPSGDVRLSDLP